MDFNFFRASSVVNCQSTPLEWSLRQSVHAATARRTLSMSCIRTLKHCRVKTLNSFSTRPRRNDLPCMPKQLNRLFVHRDEGKSRIKRSMINLQNFLHASDEFLVTAKRIYTIIHPQIHADRRRLGNNFNKIGEIKSLIILYFWLINFIYST